MAHSLARLIMTAVGHNRNFRRIPASSREIRLSVKGGNANTVSNKAVMLVPNRRQSTTTPAE